MIWTPSSPDSGESTGRAWTFPAPVVLPRHRLPRILARKLHPGARPAGEDDVAIRSEHLAALMAAGDSFGRYEDRKQPTDLDAAIESWRQAYDLTREVSVLRRHAEQPRDRTGRATPTTTIRLIGTPPSGPCGSPLRLPR